MKIHTSITYNDYETYAVKTCTLTIKFYSLITYLILPIYVMHLIITTRHICDQYF